jgi:hypothetical protein
VAKLSNFVPSTNGLHYANFWPNEPDLKVPIPGGTIPIGNASNGLCGGMAFVVRDLFEAHRLPPATTTNPSGDSPAFNYIVKRLFDSFNIPGGVAQYFEWMNLPTHDTMIGPSGTSHRTIEDEMPKLRATIDSGHPCPIGLVCIHSANPMDMGQNHQVLAYGYEDQGPTTTVWVYDSNHPDANDVTIAFDHTNPAHTTTFTYSTGDHTVLGFFTVPYTASDPSSLFEDGTTPPPGWQSPQPSAVVSGSVQLVFQPFPDVDTVSFSAYYAANPANVATVGWHAIGNGTRQPNGTFTLSWNSASICDQGNAGWGTVNLAAGSAKQGTPVNPTCYRLVSTKNGVAYAAPKALACGYSPRPIPLGKPVTATVTAKDEATGAAVAATVTVALEGQRQYSGPANQPFQHTFTAKTMIPAGAGHAPEGAGRVVYPVVTVTAPGYPAVSVPVIFEGI